jgi:broad specificity phosphatase PhoE
MESKTIYLIRHGETDYNKRGVVQGSGIDSDLNETGRAQAKAFFDYYGEIPFQKVYTSALKRTHQSVSYFLEKNLPHHILPGLNEISWGEKEGRVPNDKDDIYYNELISGWEKGHTHVKIPGGESPEEVVERQKEALKHILEQKHEELILVAMHGRAMRILLTHLLELPLSQMNNFEHANLCLYKLEFSYKTNKFSLLEANNILHLDALQV